MTFAALAAAATRGRVDPQEHDPHTVAQRADGAAEAALSGAAGGGVMTTETTDDCSPGQENWWSRSQGVDLLAFLSISGAAEGCRASDYSALITDNLTFDTYSDDTHALGLGRTGERAVSAAPWATTSSPSLRLSGRAMPLARAT